MTAFIESGSVVYLDLTFLEAWSGFKREGLADFITLGVDYGVPKLPGS
jgi:hypothetical protein